MSQVLDNNQKVYNDLISQKDIMTKRLAQDLDMATKTLSKAYNDAVSQDMQEALKGINALDTTGAMNTKAGLIQARSYIDSILQNNIQNLTNYYGGLQTINKQYQAYHQEYLDQQKAGKEEQMARQTVDTEITNNNADGYAYNKFGEKIVGASGIPVTYTANKQIQNVIDNGDGTSTFIYKNGTYETKNLGATVGEEAVQGYAQMLASGRLNIGDIPASVRSHVVQLASQLPQAGEWEFREIKDANGNSVTVRYNKATNEVVDAMTGRSISNTIANSMDLSGNHDLSYLASKYPGQAWAKNNNPSGLTWGISNELKQMLLDAGIVFGEGGKRPAGEGGAYIKFNSIEDGLKAYQISLTQRGDDVYSRLYSWSAGGDNSTPEATKLANKQSYANGLMKQAGIPQGAKFSQLSPEQLQKLMQAQIRRESPGLADVLSSPEFQQGKMTQAQV